MKYTLRPCLRQLLLCQIVTSALLYAIWLPAAHAETPTEVLRANIAKGIEVLTDPHYRVSTQQAAQRQRLCAIAHEMFDPYLFSKLTLGPNWRNFSADEQKRFVDSFGSYLCRYYLSRLQQRYTNENIVFVEETFKSERIATVKVEVLWQDSRVPVEVRMALREGRWRAYDLVFMGVSAVLVYRTQFNDALRVDTPAALIETLRAKDAG